MPKLNPSNGKSVMGLTTLISVDGVIPPALVGTEAFGGHWLDAAGNVIVYQQNSVTGTAYLQTLDLDTSVLTTVSPSGTSAMSAGGNVWAAFSGAGVRTNVTGLGPLSNAGLCEVSSTGQTATVTNINTGGLAVYNSTGTRIYSTSGPVSGVYPQRLRSSLLSWVPTTAQGWQIVNISTGEPISWQRQTVTVFALVPVVTGGRTCVLEMTDEGANQVLWFREAAGSMAYRVTTGPVFQPDIIELSAGVVRIAWSVTTAEGPTSLRVADLTVGTGATSLGTSAAGALTFSAGPSVSLSQIAVSPYTSSEGIATLFVAPHPFTDPKTGRLTTEFGDPWVRQVTRGLGSPIDLGNNVTGVLGPANGGTGGDTGLTVLDGSDIVGIIPVGPLANVPNVGFWTPLTAGTALNLSQVTAQSGYWSPLMSGPDAATSALVLTATGDTIDVWTQTTDGPMLPALIEDSSGAAIAVFEPTPDEVPFT